MIWDFILRFPLEINTVVVFSLLSFADLVQLDRACASKKSQEQYRGILAHMQPINMDVFGRVARPAMLWMAKRGMKVQHIKVHGDDPNLVEFVCQHIELFPSIRIVRETHLLKTAVDGDEKFAQKITHIDNTSGTQTFCEPTSVPNLTSLTLCFDSRSEEFIMKTVELIQGSDKLTTLDVSSSKGYGGGFYKCLAHRACTLTTLRLAANGRLTDSDLAQIGACCPNLQVLVFDNLSGRYVAQTAVVTIDVGLIALAQGCPDLVVFDGRGVTPTAAALGGMLQHCRRLKKLCLKHALLTNDSLIAVADVYSVTGLESSSLEHWEVSWGVTQDSAVRSFVPAVRNVRTLCVYLPPQTETSTGDALAALLSLMPNLQDISLTGQQGVVTFAAVHALANMCSHLRRLEVILPHGALLPWPGDAEAATSAMEATLVQLARKCRYLEELRLPEAMVISDTLLWALAGLNTDEAGISVDTSGTSALERTLQTARRCSRLRVLHCKEAQLVTDAGVAALAQGCPLLQELALSGTPCVAVTDAALDALASNSSMLHTLALPHSPLLSGAGLSHLCTTLKRLQLLTTPSDILTRQQEMELVTQVRLRGGKLRILHPLCERR